MSDQVDLTHSAGTQHAHYLVASKHCTILDGHGRGFYLHLASMPQDIHLATNARRCDAPRGAAYVGI